MTRCILAWWKVGRVPDTVSNGTQTLEEGECVQDIPTRVMITKHGKAAHCRRDCPFYLTICRLSDSCSRVVHQTSLLHSPVTLTYLCNVTRALILQCARAQTGNSASSPKQVQFGYFRSLVGSFACCKSSLHGPRSLTWCLEWKHNCACTCSVRSGRDFWWRWDRCFVAGHMYCMSSWWSWESDEGANLPTEMAVTSQALLSMSNKESKQSSRGWKRTCTRCNRCCCSRRVIGWQK